MYSNNHGLQLDFEVLYYEGYITKMYSMFCLLQGATQKRSRAAVNKATQNSSTEPSSHASVTSIEKRAPALSVSCLCHLLNAVLDDGLVADSEAQARSLN